MTQSEAGIKSKASGEMGRRDGRWKQNERVKTGVGKTDLREGAVTRAGAPSSSEQLTS